MTSKKFYLAPEIENVFVCNEAMLCASPEFESPEYGGEINDPVWG